MARPHRSRVLLALTLAAALVLGGAISVATGRVAVAGSVVVATGTGISETASSGFHFDTCGFEMLPLGSEIDLTFFDADTTSAHTFTILDKANYQVPPTDGPQALDTLLGTYHTLVNTTAQPGGWGNNSSTPFVVSFASPATASWYEFVCWESGHFQAGMYGFIAFGEALPASLSCGSGAPGPGLAVFIIVGTIVTLTVLAIVLGFVVGRRKGAVHEMPPERLGYAEPPTPEPLPSAPPRPPPGG
jgi:hypothetical protein